MKLKMTRLLLLAAVVGFAAFLAGCDDRGADEGPGFNNGSNPNGPTEPPFCEDPTQLFTIDFIHPEDGATNISVGTDIVVNFSHEPAASSIGTSISSDLITLISANGTEVDLTYTVEGDTAFFTPASLNDDTTYTFTIKTSTASEYRPNAVQAKECANTANPKFITITDENGVPVTDDNGDPVDEIDTTFTTGAVNDLAVTDTNPDDGASAVDPDNLQGVTITFNQQVQSPVMCTGTTANIVLEDLNGDTDPANDAAVEGSCTVNGNIVTFTPTEPLEVNENFRLTAKSGADGVQPLNEYAEPLAEPFVAEFHTEDLASVVNCDAPAAGICVLDAGGGGLVNVLLDEENGPLAPIAGNIGGKDKLVTILTDLLENPDGSLPGILKGLLQEGQLQEAVRTLLLDPDEGLQAILPELLQSVPELLTEGVGGLLESLLTGTDTTACQAALGTVCLVGQGDKVGVLDMLIGDKGYLGSAGLAQQELVDILGATLESGDGSLKGLVQGLFQEGQLAEGLQALLLGNETTEGGQPGLLNALQSLGQNLAEGLVNTLATLLGVDPGSVGDLGDLLGNLPLLGDLLGGLGDLVDEIPVLGDILGPLLP